jgi:hypothetical protein
MIDLDHLAEAIRVCNCAFNAEDSVALARLCLVPEDSVRVKELEARLEAIEEQSESFTPERLRWLLKEIQVFNDRLKQVDAVEEGIVGRVEKLEKKKLPKDTTNRVSRLADVVGALRDRVKHWEDLPDVDEAEITERLDSLERSRSHLNDLIIALEHEKHKKVDTDPG